MDTPPPGLHLCQQKYVSNLLKRDQMEFCSSVATPASFSTKLSSLDDQPFHDQTLFRSIVGALHYLAFTRPDIAYSVDKVS
ncbi:hypothetical protein KY290_015714 [Solanum tuberosum]|uniref:Mitochondrial protein n=1 Tax=Solanum tuberosum TaxID=4113 RepID=A0ABQ7VV62_SOLTU|nr:hypothetical protein KY289_015403 [Solanum tuberosum]KAH0700841.1 hypothetical protein KY284_015056 [Solanum tuberosum]KAH0719043.1 hypothetical protein KY285_015074 [Solanum tuberosum]KAH0771733.1 hypothetical protein KY290_015714 [Solanum tuberosum]